MNSLLVSAVRIVIALAGFQVLTTGFQGFGYSYGVSAMGAVGVILAAFFVYYYRLDQKERKAGE